MAYPTITDVKAWLNISGSGEDAQLTILLNGIIKYIELATGRVFVAASATRTFPIAYPYIDVRHTRRVLTLHEDLYSVSSITNGDGVVIAVTEYDLLGLAAPYYQIRIRPEAGKIFVASSVGAGVAVAGTWGATSDVPADILQIIMELTVYRYRLRQNSNAGAAMMVNKGGTVTQVAETPKYIVDALAERRRYRL
jgi:uncharacterized phiE125 gp8 family phage protein